MAISKTEQLFRTLPYDVQFDIDMQLYEEFNNYHIYVDKAIYNGILPESERSFMNRLETYRKRDLIKKWLKENKK